MRMTDENSGDDAEMKMEDAAVSLSPRWGAPNLSKLMALHGVKVPGL